MTEAMTEQKPLNVEEAAAFLDISVSHLYKLTSKGAIPHYKPTGKRLYFFISDLSDYVRAGRVKTADEVDSEAANFVTAGGHQ